jgi:glucose-1-phosphate adenylyltransferase
MIRQHRRNRARVTIAVKPVESPDTQRLGMVQLDGTRVVRFEEKPPETELRLANLGIYLFDTEYLVERLQEAVPDGHYDLVWDVIMPAVRAAEVSAYVFEGFWEDVGELDAFYNTNRSLLPAASGYLMDRRWAIFTASEERPPAKFGPAASVHNSVIANGCRIYGHVERSILFPGVLVGEGAAVRDSILFSEAAVYRRAQVSRCILDKRVVVGDDAVLGSHEAQEAQLGRLPDAEAEVRTREGLTVVGRESRIPAGFECRRPTMFDSYLSEESARAVEVWSGEAR